MRLPNPVYDEYKKKAAANDEMRRQMEAEEMIDRLINRESEEKLNKQAEEYEGKLMQKEEELMQKDEDLKQKDREIEELRRLLGKK